MLLTNRLNIPILSSNLLKLVSNGLLWLCPFIVLCNQFDELEKIDHFFRASTPMLCLGCAFTISLFNPKLALAACLFALPLLPNFAFELAAFVGYGRIWQSQYAGFDLVSGFCFGTILHNLIFRKTNKSGERLPWSIGILIIYLTLSVALAISRNLSQSYSMFHLSVLTNNLLHLRELGWHNDYRPLLDWIAYGCALTFLVTGASILRETKNRDHWVFVPLMLSLLFSIVVGILQSQKGIGLQWFHLFFRVDHLGFVALGLQPDIHAFAGYMLIGALGLFGYIHNQDNVIYKWVMFSGVVTSSWLGLVLSKSKSTLTLAVIFMCLLVVIWLFRGSKYLSRVLLGLMLIACLGVAATCVFQAEMPYLLNQVLNNIGIKNLAELNLKLAYRPEIFAAAIKMFSMFPMLGLGQGEFYRQSANHELTNSYFLSIEQNGENAHNYFLQTLAETGITGFVLFSIAVLYPLLKVRHKRTLLPALVGLASMCVGNLYAHSFLVRENLFIASSFLALMYAWTSKSQEATIDSSGSFAIITARKPTSVSVASLALALGLIVLAEKEVVGSYHRFPFTFDTQCHKPQSIDRDGWTSGVYEYPLPTNARAVEFIFAEGQPSFVQGDIPFQLSMTDGDNITIVSKNLTLANHGPTTFEIALPEYVTKLHNTYLVTLRVSRCFIPKNMGMNGDERRLGLQIISVAPKF